MSINQETIFDLLKEKLNSSLPGEAAQRKMAPDGRKLRSNLEGEPVSGAVLILLFTDADGLKVIMIERARYDGVHSGQIAFPGGKKEENDADLQQTALRETFEEIGICSSEIQILGQLSKLFIPVSNICVYPYVGLVNRPSEYKIDSFEVERVIQVKIRDLLDPDNNQMSTFSGKDYTIEAPCYVAGDVSIWGASAMILSELLAMFEEND